MSFDIPTDRRYLESHEWTTTDGDTVRVGITDFAQDELGDVVFVELPDVGEDVAKETEFGVVESIKAVSDIYTPVSGTVIAANDSVLDEPELLNTDPYGEGWLFEIDGSVPEDALDAADYRDRIE